MTQVLDHGYIKLVETWGSDEGIIEAARMSTNKGFMGWGPVLTVVPSSLPSGGATIEERPGDEKLLKYLYEHKHFTPFEMAGAQFEIQAPIFVFREWHRHRTQSYNEMSARYTPLPDLNYIPTVERLMIGSGGTNKQAGTIKGSIEMCEETAKWFQNDLRHLYGQAESLYQSALVNGVPKELARVHLPVGRFSRMRASANLRNWISFLHLRCDVNAQWEIRQYANEVATMLEARFPRTMQLFRETA